MTFIVHIHTETGESISLSTNGAAAPLPIFGRIFFKSLNNTLAFHVVSYRVTTTERIRLI